MIDQQHTVRIGRTVDDVFAFVAEPTNEPSWHHDVVDVHTAQSGPLRLGARLDWKVKFLGTKDYQVEVTGFEPNHLIEITTLEGPVKPVVTHLFERDGDATRYTRRVRFKPKGLFRVLEPVLHLMPSPNARWARNLKKVLEET
ncbi:MAG: SRPBCC family protein [Actinobacteria bacterium]|nr:SRPBCC family protein [Actinomycetota bacterium]